MSKEQLIDAAYDANNDMIAVLASLDDATLLTDAFGSWSIKQVIAHIAGWQRLNTEMLRRMAGGEHPVPEGADYSDDDAMNAAFASGVVDQAPVFVFADYITAYNEFIQAADVLPGDRFAEGRFAEGRFAAKMLQGNGIDHVREHLVEIRAYLVTAPRSGI